MEEKGRRWDRESGKVGKEGIRKGWNEERGLGSNGKIRMEGFGTVEERNVWVGLVEQVKEGGIGWKTQKGWNQGREGLRPTGTGERNPGMGKAKGRAEWSMNGVMESRKSVK